MSPTSNQPEREAGGSEGIGRREFVRRLGYGSAGWLGASALGASTLGALTGCAANPRDRVGRAPNLVLIMADDMGFSDVACYGGEMRTPNIDALAAGGLQFTRFHNVARCCPSRASLLTGLYPHQAGVGGMLNDQGVSGYRGDLSTEAVTLAEVLKPAGYGTYATGKWHVTRFLAPGESNHNWPRQRGFDRFFGTLNGAGSYFEPGTLMLDNDPIENPGPNFYYTNAIADHAIQFVGEHLDQRPESPFFLYQTFTSSHWPLHAPAADIERVRGRFDVGWDRLRQERHERMLAANLVDPRWALTERDRRVPPWEEVTDRAWQLRRMEVYAAQIEVMDRAIGRLVDELDRRGVLDDTLILFLADNGGCAEELNTEGWFEYIKHGREMVGRESTLDGKPMRVGNDPSVMPGPYDTYQSYGVPWANVSNTPFRLYKSTNHNGGITTPLIAHWPAGIAVRGELRGQTGHLIDVMPTFVELSGATYPSEHAGNPIQSPEGVSLVPAFEDRSLDRATLYFEHEGSRAVIDTQFKAVARGRNGAWELYDMETDRTETHDLAERYPGELERLTTMWDDWAQRVHVLPRQPTDTNG